MDETYIAQAGISRIFLDKGSDYLRDGKHFWAVMGIWWIANPGSDEELSLDHENLIGIKGPRCMLCDKTYTINTAQTECNPTDEFKLLRDMLRQAGGE